MTNTPNTAIQAIVVMGVSGCGKSALAQSLADALDWRLIEGDLFHSAQNRQKMANGIALTDEDRADWLLKLAQEVSGTPSGVILSCSALKRRYRDTLRAPNPGLRFVHMVITPELAQARVKGRGSSHFFNPSLVASQFDALEVPTNEADVLPVSATDSLHELTRQVITWIHA